MQFYAVPVKALPLENSSGSVLIDFAGENQLIVIIGKNYNVGKVNYRSDKFPLTHVTVHVNRILNVIIKRSLIIYNPQRRKKLIRVLGADHVVIKNIFVGIILSL